jgi:radical SAM superfamily enzyme YgiQ (UPF0313 family)
MKIILIQPPIQDFYHTEIRLQPLGLAYLKAAVGRNLPDIETLIKDYHHGWGRKTIALPRELSYLKGFFPVQDKSPFSTFAHYYHFGAPYDRIVDEIAAEKPDLLAISAQFTSYFQEVLQTIAAIRKRYQVPAMLGGAHVSADPLGVLAHPEVDYIIRGEGERPLVEFLKRWPTSADWQLVANLGYKRDGRLILNPMGDNYPIDQLPTPDLSDFRPENYLFNKAPLCCMITSRSCPYRCTFCSVHLTFSENYRRRDNASILEELSLRYEQGYRIFNFEDDNLGYHRDAFKSLLTGIITRFGDKEIFLHAMNGILYLNLDLEILNLMKAAGFINLNLSLVSADRQTCLQNRRPHNLNRYLEIVQQAFQIGFTIVSYQILGLPGDTVDRMIETLVMNSRLPVLLGASPYYLTPGIPSCSYKQSFNREEQLQARLTALGSVQADTSREVIYTLLVTTRIINFLKGCSFSENSIPLGVLLERLQSAGGRKYIGSVLLQRLLTEQQLYAWTRNGCLSLPKFEISLFNRIWQSVSFIMTQAGQKISCTV